MSFLDPLNGFFNAIFGFMLGWQPIFVIITIAAIVSIIIVLAYKLVTNQTEMKRIKDQMNEYQKKMKTLRDKPEEMMKVQKEAMALNMQYMSHSMKPTLVTFIPILLIFGWMNAHFAYYPLMPDTQFTLHALAQKDIAGNISITVPDGLTVIGNTTTQWVNGNANFTLKGTTGEYLATLSSNGEEVDKAVTVTSQRTYAPVSSTYSSKVFKSVDLSNQLYTIFGLRWIWIYIIFAILFSSLLRKVLKVY